MCHPTRRHLLWEILQRHSSDIRAQHESEFRWPSNSRWGSMKVNEILVSFITFNNGAHCRELVLRACRSELDCACRRSRICRLDREGVATCASQERSCNRQLENGVKHNVKEWDRSSHTSWRESQLWWENQRRIWISVLDREWNRETSPATKVDFLPVNRLTQDVYQ